MKYKYIPLLCFIVLLLIIGCHGNDGVKTESKGNGECYYVSGSGDDHNPGSLTRPWKTLEKINHTNLKPGDNILLEGGTVYTGTIRLDSSDSGEEGKKVIIGSYGNGRAIIDGANAEGIVVKNCSHFIIRDLIVKGSGRKEGNVTDGVYITVSEYFDLDSLELFGFQHSGLHVHICSELKITSIYAHDNGFAGIHVTGTTINDPVNYDNENIYVGYCIAENNPGDPTVTDNHSGNGILASSVRGGTIEYCEASNNGWDMPWTGNGPVGIWIWDCTDFIIQHCISHNNKTNPIAADGGGFDLDGGVSNSVIQYCLSYNNQGAGYGLFEFGAAKPWENNIIRFNISQDDGIVNGGSLAIWRNETAGAMRNCEIYNNTFYNSNGRGNSLWIYNNWPDFHFRNNIFIYKGSFLYPGQKLAKELFQSNCYWNLKDDQSIAGYKNLLEWSLATGNEKTGDSFVGIYADPDLQSPGTCSLTDPGKLDPANLTAYYLKTGSPLIDRGLDLKKLFSLESGIKDIVGTALPQGKGFDIGAVEHVYKK
ncbi:MAG: right-handed parallel beta-helix repeat-containing protein [Bacteroidia bacterium]|nr:right-handed parallel beta-helix repeat-containing protein [Bacteroidia bacterium]